jgi:outer membrane receptor protein involved in Fe transport
MQLTVNTSLNDRVDLRIAYKTFDIKTDYKSGLKQVPLQAEHRWFAFVGYGSVLADGKQWRADATLHRVGRQRRVASFTIPSDLTAGFSLLSMQLTRQFSNQLSVYAGAENILDVKQTDAVLSSDDPFGAAFDSSQLYAPVFGRMLYAGFRFNL